MKADQVVDLIGPKGVNTRVQGQQQPTGIKKPHKSCNS